LRLITWFYIVVVSLMVDLPEDNEDWSLTPEFKNGPLTRVCLIILYTIVLFVLYKDKDIMINFRNSEGLILPRAKMRYYLYNLSLLIYAVYIFTHESMDPSIKRQFPFPDQEKERLAKS